MLARANFDQYAAANFALSHARFFTALASMPHRAVHKLLVSVIWLETWLRWPLKTLKMQDALEELFSTLDPDGRRFGLSAEACAAFRKIRLYYEVPDLFVLLTGLDRRRFRQRALVVENADILSGERERGPGAIVVGFRLGPYPMIPLTLGSLGYPVSMIVGAGPLVEMGQGLGQTFAPRSAQRVRYMSALDPLVLARCLDDLNDGRLVCTLMELSPRKYAKTAEVRFLEWPVRVPYGVPYLAAMTGRSIVPAVMTRESGPRFRLRFLDPLPPPTREKASILQSTQDLYSLLEQQVLRFPDQWVGWTLLNSHMGVDLRHAPPVGIPAIS